MTETFRWIPYRIRAAECRCHNKISNKANTNNNSKEKEELIVEHVFDYYHYDNNDDINKNIKLFNKENSLSRNIIKNNKKEKEKKYKRRIKR